MSDKQRVLITGGAGGVGAYLARAFAACGYAVRVFDLPTDNNKKVFRPDEADIETAWGDITDAAAVREAVRGMDEIYHLAALVPPITEIKPELARKVNVEGTRVVVEAAAAEAESAGRPPVLRFSSSATVFGPTMHLTPPIPPDHPVNPDSVYAETKVTCENIVRDSGLPFTIFRFAAAQYLSIRKGSFKQMRIIPPGNRIEFIHIRDIADAFLNTVGNEAARGKTFVLSGGPRCQMLYRDQIKRTLGALGLPDPDWSKFETKPFALDWYDTSEAQRILNFQNRTFDDFLKEFTAGMGVQLPLMRYAAGPLMRLLRIRL